MIVSELVTNALKHAFPGDREGVVTVRLTTRSPERMELVVTDNGIGIPPIEIAQAQTFGLRLVNMLTHQLRAKLEMTGSGGTTVRLDIPLSV